MLTISHFNRRYLSSRVGEDVGRRTHVVHLGVPVDALPARTRSPAPSLSVVCTASGLGETKGIPTLVEACAILKRRGVAVRCTIAGADLAGTAVGELRAAVAAAGLENEVVVAGLVPSPRWLPLVAAADVFVLPCVPIAGGGMDGIPVSLIEAMGIGVPVITTGISGIPELVRAGRTGLLVPPRDPGAVADALEWVRTRPAAAERIGARGRRFVARYFSSAASAEGLLTAWRHPVPIPSARD